MARYIIIFMCLSHWAGAQTSSVFKPAAPALSFLPAAAFQPAQKISLHIQPLKHEAFFCKMEDKLHNRFNVWLTLRAGSDESYRKLIEKREN